MFNQPIGSLNLPESKIQELYSKGYVYREDVKVLNEEESSTRVPEMKSALDVLQDESYGSCIVTFCRELDDVLGGGVPTKLITEFDGLPGSGKTQMW